MELLYNSDGTVHEYQRMALIGEHLWYMQVLNGRVYFIDENSEIGSIAGLSYSALRSAGLIQMTQQWVSPSMLPFLSNKDRSAEGDALERVKRV